YQTASELIVDLERSNLAAPVPSFVDPHRALQDPVVRERLSAITQPTQLDLEAPGPPVPTGNGNYELWYLRFRDRDGRGVKPKPATTRQLLQYLREGRLPPEAEAPRQLPGEFRPLAIYPEFRHPLTLAPTIEKKSDRPEAKGNLGEKKRDRLDPQSSHEKPPGLSDPDPAKLGLSSRQAEHDLETLLPMGKGLWLGLAAAAVLILIMAAGLVWRLVG